MRAITATDRSRSSCCSPAAGGDEDAAPAGEGGTTKLNVQETAGVPSAFVGLRDREGHLRASRSSRSTCSRRRAAPPTIPALVSGDIQVGGSNVVSLLLAARKDLPIRAIAGGTNAQRRRARTSARCWSAKGGAIREPEDLEGKTVAVNTLHNIAEVVVKAALEKQGVDPDSLEALRGPVPGDGAGAGRRAPSTPRSASSRS